MLVTAMPPSSVDAELDGREAVVVVVVSEAQQSLVSDGSVQSLPASHCTRPSG